MNGKSMHINQDSSTRIDLVAERLISLAKDFCHRIQQMVCRSELQKAQAHYRAKRERLGEDHRDVYASLSLEDKLRFGMYRKMD